MSGISVNGMDIETKLRPAVISPARLRAVRLQSELVEALRATDRTIYARWGARLGRRCLFCGVRRVRNLTTLITVVGTWSVEEARLAVAAIREKSVRNHVRERTDLALHNSMRLGARIARSTTAVATALYRNPSETAPQLLALTFGFLTGSGGLDGNGGIPDLDFDLGIGHHRSPLTHSILSGIVIETLALGFIDLVCTIADKLPENRDPIWDVLVSRGSALVAAASVGASAGIAYHLGVDATLQPAAYHDMPFSMPIEAHQTIMGANAVAEGVDVAKRNNTVEV